MASERPSRQERRNQIARELGFRNEYERNQQRRMFRANGLPLGDRANERMIQGFLRSIGTREGSDRPARPTRRVMNQVLGMAQSLNMNRRTRDMSVAAYLEDQGIIDPDERDWDEWWDNYTGESG